MKDDTSVTGAATSVERNIELAFSGGGMRAAAFALGVLMYVVDAGTIQRIRQISSVSGGSITNGFIANLLTSKRDISDESISDFFQRLTSKGIRLEEAGQLFATSIAFIILLFAVGFLCLGLAALGLSSHMAVPALLCIAIAITLALFMLRWFRMITDTMAGALFAYLINDSTVTAAPPIDFLDFLSSPRLGSKFLNVSGLKLRKLCDISSPITHVFTSTDLRHGEHFHFSQDWATSNTYGSTDPGDVRVDEAVRASSAFPGALPPVNLALERIRLPPTLTVGIGHLQLVDGGVRDNLGHIFQTHLLDEPSPQRDTLTRYGSTQYSIVVDASAPRGVADLSESVLNRLPLLRRIGQLVSFPRVIGILNQSNSEARSLTLSAHFDRRRNGFVAQIRDSPVEVCCRTIDDAAISQRLLQGNSASSSKNDLRKLRAESALQVLIHDDHAAEAHWNGVCSRNSTIPTTLNALGSERVVALVRHGYVLTMCLAHIELEWPLLPNDRWSVNRFTKILEDKSGSFAIEGHSN